MKRAIIVAPSSELYGGFHNPSRYFIFFDEVDESLLNCISTISGKPCTVDTSHPQTTDWEWCDEVPLKLLKEAGDILGFNFRIEGLGNLRARDWNQLQVFSNFEKDWEQAQEVKYGTEDS